MQLVLWVDMLVLILIVVEDGLVRNFATVFAGKTCSLNPCCSGRWSRTLKQDVNEAIVEVLILVVVEDGLVRSPS